MMKDEGLGIEPQAAPTGSELPLPIQVEPANATPVYGTARPTAGPAAALRRRAYRYPAHDPLRWMLLLAADRAESTGQLAREAVTPGRQALVLRHFSRQARAEPAAFATLAGVLLGGLFLGVAAARRRRP
jgi:hypothetical protein